MEVRFRPARQDKQATQAVQQNRCLLEGTLPTLVVLLLLAGCSSSPSGSNRFTLFPEVHVLSEKARQLVQRDSPLDLPRELDKHPLPPYRVEPGDVLEIIRPVDPSELPDEAAPDKKPLPPINIPANQPILPDGTINLGQFGRLVVAGKTAEEIEGMVRAIVQAHIKRDPGFINVRILVHDSKVYYVLGEVNSPGAFPLKGRETVLDGLMAAGGLHDRGSRYNIILTRPTKPDGCRIVLPICWYDITQVGDTSTNYQLMPGDRIYVPTRTMFEAKKAAKSCGPCNRDHVPCEIPVKPPHHPVHPVSPEQPIPPLGVAKPGPDAGPGAVLP